MELPEDYTRPRDDRYQNYQQSTPYDYQNYPQQQNYPPPGPNGQYQNYPQQYPPQQYQQYPQQYQKPSYPLRPCVIPPLRVSEIPNGPSFVRTRVPELEAVARLPPSELLGFIDGLNRILNPPAPANNGGFRGFVQSAAIQLVNSKMDVVSNGRVQEYMASVNGDIFMQRGLKAHICSTEELVSRLGMGEYGLPMGTMSPYDVMGAFGDRVMELSPESGNNTGASDNWMAKLGAISSGRKDKKIREAEAEMEQIQSQMQALSYQIQEIGMRQPKDWKKTKRDLEKDYKDLEKDLRDAEKKYREEMEKHGDKSSGHTVNSHYWIVIVQMA
ncbi:hypothetical protein ASPZODRAFT_170242 [Penicilliopsis zonata CBS 506.65]|uniref:Uncharacterized protein n=1 Tax=Penicilliopsis zonata CBS 506.65 TaxID=1073090 RepID=A0A1L9S527_9EURO|nr:hypothetical protein ASPZODRAFT_170242 [Penicilliopsis zonata CBS 506.65]OJJ42279.1 hypothetical protein ASPZODRAFT_170242 [Penicilliopsis zonata CBS 506.65]